MFIRKWNAEGWIYEVSFTMKVKLTLKIKIICTQIF